MTLTFEFERYLNIRSAYTPAWLEDGQRVAFLTDVTGTPQVWAVVAAGGWPEEAPGSPPASPPPPHADGPREKRTVASAADTALVSPFLCPSQGRSFLIFLSRSVGETIAILWE